MRSLVIKLYTVVMFKCGTTLCLWRKRKLTIRQNHTEKSHQNSYANLNIFILGCLSQVYVLIL